MSQADFDYSTDVPETGPLPRKTQRAIRRLRKEAEAEVERLVAFLDAIDDPDLEDDDVENDPADLEPTLGSSPASDMRGYSDQSQWATPDVSEREPECDFEPSLGWTSTGGVGGLCDLEWEDPEDDDAFNDSNGVIITGISITQERSLIDDQSHFNAGHQAKTLLNKKRKQLRERKLARRQAKEGRAHA